jgi:hypothetical protein
MQNYVRATGLVAMERFCRDVDSGLHPRAASFVIYLSSPIPRNKNVKLRVCRDQIIHLSLCATQSWMDPQLP